VDDRVANTCDIGNKLISVSVIENVVTEGGGVIVGYCCAEFVASGFIIEYSSKRVYLYS